MNLFKFGEFEVEVDATDVAFIEKYEDAFAQYEIDAGNIPKNGKSSETIRGVCAAFFKLFDALFGEGTHQLMFGDRQSVELCSDATYQLISVVKKHSGSVAEKMQTPNREQRRAKK